MTRILLAVGNPDLNNEFHDMLTEYEDLLGLSVLTADTCARAEQHCRKHKDISFVVLAYDLPAGPHSSEENPSAMALARNFDKQAVQGIILGPLQDAKDRVSIHSLKNFISIDMLDSFEPTEDGIPHLIDQIHRMRSEVDEVIRPERGQIEVTIEEKNVGRCRTTVVINDCSMLLADEPFQCDSRVLVDLLSYTKNLNSAVAFDNAGGFLDNFRSVGRKTREMILHEPVVKEAIAELIRQTGDPEKVWFRFRVTHRSVPPIPFEAILRCDKIRDENDEFQLALSPVYRVTLPRSHGNAIRPPLFTGSTRQKTRLNCLVIDASTKGTPAPRNGIEFPNLEEICYGREEADAVVKIIQEQCGSRFLVKPEIVTFDDDESRENPVSFLSDKFDSGKWDLVHFIGHSFYNPAAEDERNSAYIFLPGKILPVAVSITRFGGWLTSSAFLYLSSCQSAEPGFIQVLSEKPIPTIVGYRWKVSDRGATTFAKRFYENLFSPSTPMSIERAFAQTQRDLMNPDSVLRKGSGEKPDLPIWAYPMLVMQNAS